LRTKTQPQTANPTTRNDAAEWGFPTHLQRDYNLKIIRMQKALDRRLVAAGKIAISDAHFKRLADKAVADVLLAFKHNDMARDIVASFHAWVALAWKSHQPVPSALTQKAEALGQMQAMRTSLNKHANDYVQARVAVNPEQALEKAAKRALNRAAFYARDQAGNLYNKAATQQASYEGFQYYEWVRTTSASPRDVHMGRVGQIFKFGELSDPPGVLPNCKCSMRPVKTADG